MNYNIWTSIISIAINVLQTVSKCFIGYYHNSNALFADGLHGFSDIIINTVILVAAVYAAKPADHFYPYGRGRYESLAVFGIALLTILVAINLLFLSIVSENAVFDIDYLVMAITSLSLCFSLIAFFWMYYHAKKSSSDLIYSNALHQLSDALSSFVVMFSCVAAYFGYSHSDALATVFVVFLIIYSVLPLLKSSLLELTDHATNKHDLNVIAKKILAFPEVYEIHHLRTRRSAGRVILDTHITVNHNLSFTESHWIAEKITSLLKSDNLITDVLIHVDPDVSICNDLHERAKYIELWSKHIPHEALLPEYLIMHYLSDGILIDWKTLLKYQNDYKSWRNILLETDSVLAVNLLIAL